MIFHSAAMSTESNVLGSSNQLSPPVPYICRNFKNEGLGMEAHTSDLANGVPLRGSFSLFLLFLRCILVYLSLSLSHTLSHLYHCSPLSDAFLNTRRHSRMVADDRC